MLDIKMIRTDGEKVKERIRKREMNLDSIVEDVYKRQARILAP